jgi:hypothetical protein
VFDDIERFYDAHPAQAMEQVERCMPTITGDKLLQSADAMQFPEICANATAASKAAAAFKYRRGEVGRPCWA